MYPVLFKENNFTIHTWSVFMATAFVVGIVWTIIRGKKVGIEPIRILRGVVFIMIGVLVGGKVFEGIKSVENLKDFGRLFLFWEQGVIGFGSTIGGFAVGMAYIKKKLPFWKTLDIIAPPVALGVVLIKIGCFFNHCF
jgi:prolipoprotein diacylglyceryltransferase